MPLQYTKMQNSIIFFFYPKISWGGGGGVEKNCSACVRCEIFGLLDLFAYTTCICADFIVLTVCIFFLPVYSFIVCWSYAYITSIVLHEIYSTFQRALDRTYCITS